MTRYLIPGHFRSEWRALPAAPGLVAGSVGAVLILIPAGAAWPSSSLADAFASPAVLDWAKGSLGLIFMMRRRFGTARGGQQ